MCTQSSVFVYVRLSVCVGVIDCIGEEYSSNEWMFTLISNFKFLYRYDDIFKLEGNGSKVKGLPGYWFQFVIDED